MKKLMQRTKLIGLSLFMMLFMAGCGTVSSPEADLKDYATAVIHYDDASAKKFNETAAELEETFRKNFLKESVQSDGLNKEQANQICDELIAFEKRSNFKVELVSKDDKSAKVKITIDMIDFDKMIAASEKAAEQAPEIKQISNPQERSRKAVEIYTNNLVQSLKNSKAQEQTSFEVDCKFNKDLKMWVPVDEADFDEQFMSAMLNQK